jgi:hypothetical protein
VHHFSQDILPLTIFFLLFLASFSLLGQLTACPFVCITNNTEIDLMGTIAVTEAVLHFHSYQQTVILFSCPTIALISRDRLAGALMALTCF